MMLARKLLVWALLLLGLYVIALGVLDLAHIVVRYS